MARRHLGRGAYRRTGVEPDPGFADDQPIVLEPAVGRGILDDEHVVAATDGVGAKGRVQLGFPRPHPSAALNHCRLASRKDTNAIGVCTLCAANRATSSNPSSGAVSRIR